MNRDHADLVTEFCNSLLAADMAKTVCYLSDDVVYWDLATLQPFLDAL